MAIPENLFELVDNQLKLVEGSVLNLETLAETGAIRWNCPDEHVSGELITPFSGLSRDEDDYFDLRCPGCEEDYCDFVNGESLPSDIAAVLKKLLPLPEDEEDSDDDDDDGEDSDEAEHEV